MHLDIYTQLYILMLVQLTAGRAVARLAYHPIRALDSDTPPELRLVFSAAIFEDTLCSHDWVISTWSSRERGGLWLLEISGRNVHWFVEWLCSSHPSQLSRRHILLSNQMRSDLPLWLGCEWSWWIVWAGRSKTATIKLHGVGGWGGGWGEEEREGHIMKRRNTWIVTEIHTHTVHTHTVHTHTHPHNTQPPHKTTNTVTHTTTHTTQTQPHTNHIQPHT